MDIIDWMLLAWQIAYTGLTVEDYASSKQLWIDFIGYLVSLDMGLFNGFNVGTESMRKWYLSKLQERIKIIQQVLNIGKNYPLKSSLVCACVRA